MLIIISGSPGTGKTETAFELSKLLGYGLLDVKRIAAESKIITGFDRRRGCIIIDEKKISKAVEKKLKKGGKYIAESHLAHHIKPKFVKLCVILRCSPDVLRRRLSHRGYNHHKVAENVMSECLDTSLIEAIENGYKNKVHEIDTTHLRPAQTAKEILKVLNMKKKKSYGKIAWSLF